MSRKTLIQRAVSEYRLASATLTQTGRELTEVTQDILDHKEAQQVAQEAARVAQEASHTQIAQIVSRCLQSVFNEPYEFKIVFDKKRGKTQARFVFMLEGEEVDPLRNSAGGEVDVASFALRLAALMLHKPGLRRLLVLDESFKHLSRPFRPRVAQLLEELSEELGVQILLVTHSPELEVGKVIQIP